MNTLMKIRLAAGMLFIALAFSACSVDYPDSESTNYPRITTSGNADFTKFVVVGNSLTAGYQSGGLSRRFQINSYGAMIARQLGQVADTTTGSDNDFEQPYVTDPGTTGILRLTLGASGPTPTAQTGTTDIFENGALGRAYDNVAVPGSFVYDFTNTSSSANSWSQTRFGSTNVLFSAILRAYGTQMAQVRSLSPTFVIWWEGHNDILGYATSGAGIRGNFQTAAVAAWTPKTSTDTYAATFGYNFEDGYKASLDSLTGLGVDVIVGNIPNVTAIPYFTTVFPSSSIPGTNGVPDTVITGTGKFKLYYQDAVTADSIKYLLLPVSSLIGSTSAAIGDGNAATPYGLHPLDPIQGKYTLTIDEVNHVSGIITSYNETIAEAAASHNIPVVDFYTLFNEVRSVSGTGGVGYAVGSGIRVKTDFISGGLFSLDGVHPSSLGYAVVANEFIKNINKHYKSDIPLVNMNKFLNDSY